jgi:Zn-dependent protease/CBS domain-containing protein
MFGRSYRLPLRLLGIPVQLDLSFLLVLPLMMWIIGRQVGGFARMFGLPDSPVLHSGFMPYTLGLIAAVGLFISVVIHELGHAVVARLYGVNVKSITLWFLGGVAQFADMPRQRGAEAIVAIVGPIVSVVIGLLCWGILRIVPDTAIAARFVLAYLAYTNIVLAIFNLLPAIPLDGGRVLRSILALWMPRETATTIAAVVSRTLAVLLGIVGLISFNFFLLLIAVFIYTAVSSETTLGQVEQLLRGLTVADVMNPDVHSVNPDQALADVTDRMFREHRLAFPVTDDSGRLVGQVGLAQAQGRDPSLLVRQVMLTNPLAIPQNAPATDVFRRLGEDGFGRIGVVDDSEHLVGIVARTDLLRLLQLRAAGLQPYEWPTARMHLRRGNDSVEPYGANEQSDRGQTQWTPSINPTTSSPERTD